MVHGYSAFADHQAEALLSEILASSPTLIHLVGCGTGARAVQAVSCRWPNRVASIALVDPVIPQLLSGTAKSLRLDVIRRLALPTLIVETDIVSEAASDVARILHRISRRSRFRSVGSPSGSMPDRRGAIWWEIRSHIEERFGPGSSLADLAA
jgi:pimeloyl-ACP methyl ester carboxylesterase